MLPNPNHLLERKFRIRAPFRSTMQQNMSVMAANILFLPSRNWVNTPDSSVSFLIQLGSRGKPRLSSYGCHYKSCISSIGIKVWSLHGFHFALEFPEMLPLELPGAHRSLRVLLRYRVHCRRSGEELRVCISTEPPRDFNANGPGTTVWRPRLQATLGSF